MNTQLTLRLATPADAPAMLRVIRDAFGARAPVQPPAEALSDSLCDIESALEAGAGICLEEDGQLVACLLLEPTGDVAWIRRVSVAPAAVNRGYARVISQAALRLAADEGFGEVELVTRDEFPELAAFWTGLGFGPRREVPTGRVFARATPVAVAVPGAAAMHELGMQLAKVLRRGDVVLASGELGAGKTTLAQGLGAGLNVAGAVTSPTFVLSRVHPAQGAGPDLVHVDAYRLADAAELADIDLDASLVRAVTFIEWGTGVAEWLQPERLEIEIERSLDPNDELRVVYLDGLGSRWAGVLEHLRERK